jgi:hypothetical protein
MPADLLILAVPAHTTSNASVGELLIRLACILLIVAALLTLIRSK